VDYRILNSVTIQDAYPLPRIDESLDALAGSKYFGTLDLLSEYWPEMTRDLRLRVRQCKVCQASKHGRPTETTGRCRLYAGRPW